MSGNLRWTFTQTRCFSRVEPNLLTLASAFLAWLLLKMGYLRFSLSVVALRLTTAKAESGSLSLWA